MNNQPTDLQSETKGSQTTETKRPHLSSWKVKYGEWVLMLHKKMNKNIFVPLFLHIADHPYRYMISILLFSVSITAVAVLTGSITTDSGTITATTPQSSYTVLQWRWLNSVFPSVRTSTALIHSNGENVLTYEAVSLAWDVYDVFPSIKNYDKLCDHSKINSAKSLLASMGNGTNKTSTFPSMSTKCSYLSVTMFWVNREEFESEVAALIEANKATQEEINSYLRKKLSASVFADGTPVDRHLLFGRYRTTSSSSSGYDSLHNEELLSAQSIAITLLVTDTTTTDVSFGEQIAKLDERQREDPSANVFVEGFNLGTRAQERIGPILGDIPLLVAAFIIMSLFTAISMTRWKKNSKGKRFVTSNFLLGIGATVTIVLSAMTGYSICALCGYPITTLTQILPYVLLGIGLDDTFILVGAYYDTDPALPFKARIAALPILAVPSITVTSLTDCLAFALGASSAIPVVRWFCFYAVVCIFVDYIYQITFFVALLVLDHARSKSGRYDCLICFTAPSDEHRNEEEITTTPIQTEITNAHDTNGNHHDGGAVVTPRLPASLRSSVRETPRSNKLMLSFARFLLRPVTKIVVIVGFVGLFIIGAVFTSVIQVEFNEMDLTPINSQTDRFIIAQKDYFSEPDDGRLVAGLFYQGLDISDFGVRQQMRSFREEMTAIVGGRVEQPPYWMDEFDSFVLSASRPANSSNSSVYEVFYDEFDAFLRTEPYRTQFDGDFALDDFGNVVAIQEDFIVGIDTSTIKKQVDFLVTQREITVRQPLNQDLDGPLDRMFLFNSDFTVYEHYRLLPRELITALTLSILAVGIVSIMFLPHLTGTVLAMLVITAVDVELIGILYLAGYAINSITVIILIMSVGLTVDYCLHVLHAFFNVDATDRNGRSQLALLKIGGSVFLGGSTTFLGTLALAFANGVVFRTFFVMFVSMVVLGLGHGLVLVPVVLSIIGPDVVVVSGTSIRQSMRVSKRSKLQSLDPTTAYEHDPSNGKGEEESINVAEAEVSEDGSTDANQGDASRKEQEKPETAVIDSTGSEEPASSPAAANAQ